MEQTEKRYVGKLYNLKSTIDACIRFISSGAMTVEKAAEEINKLVLEMQDEG